MASQKIFSLLCKKTVDKPGRVCYTLSVIKRRENKEMTTFTINHTSTAKNAGIAREHDLCAYMGINRVHHDSTDYRTSSDICAHGMNISVKASAFTLMSGNMCEGKTNFDDIWTLYKSTTHSNTFAYITEDYTVYMMNIAEFEQFVYMFGRTERESEKNGGAMKIRCRKETRKMVEWLQARAA